MTINEYWQKIEENNQQLISLFSSFWNEYSGFGTWQFWIIGSLMIIPLLLLYFTVDRERLFEVFFFGYTVHVLWTYIDIMISRNGLFVHKFFLTPLLPNALNMTASALPVGFLLVYQYCTNHKKSFILYSIVLSAIFAFCFATLEAQIGFIEFNNGMNQLFLFFIDFGIAITAYVFTKILKHFKAGEKVI
ncbi:hypothetical protein [Bacillus sp. J37]|uniref:hypothetical protein n=1 Tax=Bacillus sp. J37 TaxID=935837 RepID=UPI0004797186|nr:hypothetical protein [Bacillus sp. J37]